MRISRTPHLGYDDPMNATHTNAAGLRKPPALRPGARLGVFAPSHPAHALFPDRYRAGVAALEALGYTVVEDPLVAAGKSQGYRTAPPIERAQALMHLWLEADVDGLISVIGGQNSSSLLPHLDFAALAARPKVVCGYSDVTALHMALASEARLSTFYGPAVAPSFGEPGPLPYTVDAFTAAVTGAAEERRRLEPPSRWSREGPRWDGDDWRDPAKRVWHDHPGWAVVRGGEARGPLLAGNLNTMRALTGTRYLPAFDGAILMIEEMSAPLDRWERAVTHLALMGVFDRIAGLIVGRPEIAEVGDAPFDHTQVLLEVVGAHYDFPIVEGFDCGHTHPMLTLAQGTEASLKVDDHGPVELWLEEAMVAPPAEGGAEAR